MKLKTVLMSTSTATLVWVAWTIFTAEIFKQADAGFAYLYIPAVAVYAFGVALATSLALKMLGKSNMRILIYLAPFALWLVLVFGDAFLGALFTPAAYR